MKFKKSFQALAAIATLVCASSASALLLYENSAGQGDMASFDPVTGALVKAFTQDKGNGRGVVTVGDTLYYTVAGSGSIFKRTISTNVDLGVAFSVPGSSGLQAISYDGTNFWVGDYTGTTKAYLVSPTGVLLRTITLASGVSGIEGFYDGLEYFNGKLIANRYDGGFGRAGGNQYSIYDLNGNLLTANFIDTNGHGNGTGIAYDGVNFYVSDIFNNRATIWNGLTGAFIGAVTFAGSHNAIEDLSFDFAARSDTGGVPEPTDLALFAIGLVGLAAGLRRSKTRV